MTKPKTLSAQKLKPQKPLVLAGLDIGTTKVTVSVGTIQLPNLCEMTPGAYPELDVHIVGMGTAPSSGFRQGVVINVEETIDAICKAREEAELMSGYSIDEVYVGIGGTHIRSFDSRGMIAIRNKEVRSDDIDRVIEAAKAVVVPSDREVLHVLPREYKIDEQTGISDPIGMSGVRLEANVHIITAGQSAMHNLLKCAEKAGLSVKGVVLQQMASALAVLSEDEKKLGAALIDMGGGTSDIVLYVDGAVAFTSSVPVGGVHFTQDIAMGLRTPQGSAEALKKSKGHAVADVVDESETLDVESIGGRKVRSLNRRELCQIIEPRAEEVFHIILKEIEESGLLNQVASGLVITGGASQLEGMTELGEFICEIPVRQACSDQVGGLTDIVRSPQYATSVGLILHALEQIPTEERWRLVKRLPEASFKNTVSGWTVKMREFFLGAP